MGRHQVRKGKAYAYFTLAAEQGNVYAAYFLEHWNDMPHPDLLLMATRLMHHLERVMEDNVTGRRRGGSRQGIDRKLARKMKEKKIAQGLLEALFLIIQALIKVIWDILLKVLVF